MISKGRARAHIDLSALAHNLQIARNHCPDSRVVAVVKANAYGHGLGQVGAALQTADLLAVTDVSEALQLQGVLGNRPILVLQGLIDEEDLDLVALHGFQCVVHSLEQLAMIDARLKKRPPPGPLGFWLKLDSGMGRLGIAPDDYVAAYRSLAAKPYCRQLVMMTHLANSSLPDSSLNALQLKQVARIRKKLLEQFPRLATSQAASSGILGDDEIQSDWVRPGIMLYGSSPFPWNLQQYRAEQKGLLPVMTLQSRLIAVRDLKKGDNVGYCSQFICPTKMRIGIVSIGYADGYPSNAPNGTPVLVKGKRTGTVGRVSMDMLAVDLNHLPEAQTGDVVTLWGKGLSVDEVAAHTGILSYNLLCSVTRRVNFSYG